MAGHDPLNDPTPKQTLMPDRKPTVAQLKSAISGSAVAASYPTDTLQRATYNDLRAICRAHNITVNVS